MSDDSVQSTFPKGRGGKQQFLVNSHLIQKEEWNVSRNLPAAAPCQQPPY